MKQERKDMDLPLLNGLDDQVKEAVLSLTRMKKWARGELIVSEGDVCKSLYIVTEGVAAVQKYTPAGEYSTIRLLAPGDCFGEELVFEKEGRYSNTLEAVSDVVIITIAVDQLSDMMEQYPVLKDNYLQVLFRRMKAQDQRITLLSLKTVRQKISFYLLSLYDVSEPERVILPVSKEVIAKFLSIPRPSFSRELTLMEKEGKIRVAGRTVELPDIASLRKELGEV